VPLEHAVEPIYADAVPRDHLILSSEVIMSLSSSSSCLFPRWLDAAISSGWSSTAARMCYETEDTLLGPDAWWAAGRVVVVHCKVIWLIDSWLWVVLSWCVLMLQSNPPVLFFYCLVITSQRYNLASLCYINIKICVERCFRSKKKTAGQAE